MNKFPIGSIIVNRGFIGFQTVNFIKWVDFLNLPIIYKDSNKVLTDIFCES